MAVSGGVGKNSGKKKAPAKKGGNPFQKSGGGSMTCPECGKKMGAAPGSVCPNCGYTVKGGPTSGGGKKTPPMKKMPMKQSGY